MNMEILVEILKLGSVGVIAGLFSAYIATRGHRNKKWWELRVSAYQSVIEALSDVTYYYDRKYKAEIENRELSAESEAELDKFWDDSYHKIRKAADSGVFLFSEEVNQALTEFVNLKNENSHSYFEAIDNNLVVAEKCLKAIVSSANKDLRLNDAWL
jgi:hypothetical protein